MNIAARLCHRFRTERFDLFSRRLIFLMLIVTLANPYLPSSVVRARSSLEGGLEEPQPIYLPIISTDRWPLHPSQPIWIDNSHPGAHEVVLFRHTFSLQAPAAQPELLIFADTRYQVWIDGKMIGRGPARFSVFTHEYDVYPLSDLAPGSHLIAVLVQWAPNYRRSESTTPHLIARIHGSQNNRKQILAATGPTWKVLSSPAWKENASPVHSWGLIGPTELLDLRRLPGNWTEPGFSEEQWNSAIVKTDLSNREFAAPAVAQWDWDPDLPILLAPQILSSVHAPVQANYQPRSIPLPAQVKQPIAVIGAGGISPGRRLVELAPQESGPYEFRFEAVTDTEFSLEILNPVGVSLDGKPLVWEKAPPTRPDVYRASLRISKGMHRLAFIQVNSDALTFSVSTANLTLPALPFQQGNHAGRRLLLGETVQSPEFFQIAQTGVAVSVHARATPAYIILDLGRVVHGRMAAQVKGPAGSILDIGWDERLADGRPFPFPGSEHKEWNQVDSWILDGTSRSISTIDTRAGRYILMAVWGNGPIYIEDIQVFEERYPVQDVGTFTSSDPRLDQIWTTGRNTLYANMSDAYSDPWRERGQWWGDAFTTYQTNLAAFGDLLLLRRGVLLMKEEFQDGQPAGMAPNSSGEQMLDYGMLWVQSIEDYGKLSAEISVLRETYPTVQAFLQVLAAQENEKGLIQLHEEHWSKSVLIDWLGHDSRKGISTAVNALYFSTLKDAAQIAFAVGDLPKGKIWEAKSESLKSEINQLLFLSDQGLYLTRIQGDEVKPAGPHALGWALSEGLVPLDKQDQVTTNLLALLSKDPVSPNVEIYGMYWILKGLGESGHIEEGLEIIKRYYGSLLDRGATTWWELFTADKYKWATLSHSWGSSPTWFLTHYLLGAAWEGPETWSFTPSLLGVSEAQGSVPLGTQILKAGWKQLSCGKYELSVQAPSNTAGTILIPFNNPEMVVYLDGNVILEDGKIDSENLVYIDQGLSLSLPGGEYSISLDRGLPCDASGDILGN